VQQTAAQARKARYKAKVEKPTIFIDGSGDLAKSGKEQQRAAKTSFSGYEPSREESLRVEECPVGRVHRQS
jgi:hypothetical protein